MDRELWLRMVMKGFKIKYLPGQVNASFRLVKGTKTFEYTKVSPGMYEVMLAALNLSRISKIYPMPLKIKHWL